MAIMLVITLCFTGLFIMFCFMLRNQSVMHKTLCNELAQTRARLHQIEARLEGIVTACEDSMSNPIVDSPPPIASGFTQSTSASLSSIGDLSMTKNTEEPADTGLHLHLDSPEKRH